MSSFQLITFSESEDSYEGGYDYEFVSGPPSDDYTCLICSLVAREAQQASCCGKIFCKECLEKCARVKDSCPNCREDLNGKYFPDRRAIRDINQLNVYCKNKDEGCTWEGELRQAQTHQDSCPYCQVQCPNQCTEAVRNMDLPHHLETECPKRKVECCRCKQIGEYAYISTDHSEDCPDVQIDCPNEGCEVKPKRMNMEAHRQLCPKEIINCEYAQLGCEHVCLRENIADHNEQSIQSHLQLAMKELTIHRTMLESRTGSPQGHVFKLTSFSKLKEKRQEWYSPPFYTFPGGYKMSLRVDAGGHKDGKGTHISAYLYLMAGENDNNLEWPMRGTFSMEILNQEKDGNHQEHSVHFAETRANKWNSKVMEGRATLGWGISKFFQNQYLEMESPPSETQYLKDDTLYFRVTMTEQISKSKPWLTGATSS